MEFILTKITTVIPRSVYLYRYLPGIIEVNTMFFNGSARVQLWLGYPDKFYDSNKNLALDVRHEACL
jgi:hypothetical protein